MQTPIGEMRESVAILTPIRTVDSSGGEEYGWGVSDPLFMAIRATSTREALAFGQVNADVTHVAFGHWAELNQLTSKQRIRILETGQEFDIAGLPVNDPKRAWTRLSLIWRENG